MKYDTRMDGIGFGVEETKRLAEVQVDVGTPGTMLVSAGLTIARLLEDEESNPANNYKHLSTEPFL